MPLLELKLTASADKLPSDVREFLAEANARIASFQEASRVPGFVPSDYARVYGWLRALAEANLAPGGRFCEWGCGFGVVAGLAALLDFEACGIEIDEALAAEAQQLADDFSLPVEILRGSFIPKSAEGFLDRVYARKGDGFSWMTTDCDSSLEAQGFAPDDFDVIFAYPWPDEEQFVAGLFERTAADGAVLVTHSGGDGFRLRRKSSKRQPKPARGRRSARSSRR